MLHGRSAAARLCHHNPLAEIVTVLRNPVDRAYSAYWHSRRMGWETLETFEEALAAEPRRLATAAPGSGQIGYVARGRCAQQLELLMALFGKERVQVFLIEDLGDKPAEACRQVWRLMASTPTSHRASKSATTRRWRHGQRWLPAWGRRTRSASFCPPPMRPETRGDLEEAFAADHERLALLIDRRLDVWQR